MDLDELETIDKQFLIPCNLQVFLGANLKRFILMQKWCYQGS